MSADSTVVWSPEKLVGMPGNWGPVKYAIGDPVNYIDPNGQYAQIIIGAAIGGFAGAITASATNNNILQGVLIGGITGASFASGAWLVSGVASVAAQSSIVSIFTFTGNMLAQGLVSKKIDIVEASSVGLFAPLSLGYSKLFNTITSKMCREFSSGMSFMSIDLAGSFGANAFNTKFYNQSTREFSLGTYKLNTSYSN